MLSKKRQNWLLKLSENQLCKYFYIINWFRLCRIRTLNESFLREFADYFDWDEISLYQKLSIKFILEFRDKINLKYILVNNQFNEDELEQIIHSKKQQMEWGICKACQFQKLSEQFMQKYYYALDWEQVIEHQKYSKEFENKFKKQIQQAKVHLN